MTWERIQNGPTSGLDTHESPWFRKGWLEACNITHHLSNTFRTVDVFARKCPWADITNDLNPQMPTDYHLDGIQFLEKLLDTYGPGLARVIILDPPFSDRQATRYVTEEMGSPNLYTTPGYMAKLGALCAQLLVPGGVVLKLGYNSNAPTPHLELVKGWTVTFGGNRNDVQMSIWTRPDCSLEQWLGFVDE